MSKRSSTRVTFSVSLQLPPGVTMDELQNYVRTSVACWKGGGDPQAPLYQLDGKSVEVRLLKRETTYL